jgi:DnaJ-class molecular chaperone
MTSATSHTASGCSCAYKDYAASWHDATCARSANQCDYCSGNGGQIITLSCECCSDWETCDQCHGTGNAHVSDEQQVQK